MNTKEIYSSLMALERSLSEINSASDMVKEISSAYKDVFKQIKNYSDNLSKITEKIEEIISKIKNNRDVFFEDAEKLFDFKISKIDNIVNEVDKLKRYFSDDLKINIENSVRNVDDELSSIDNNIDSLKLKIESSFSKVIESANEKLNLKIDRLDQITDKINSIKKDFIENSNLTTDKLQEYIKLNMSMFDKQIEINQSNFNTYNDFLEKRTINFTSKIEKIYGDAGSQIDDFLNIFKDKISYIDNKKDIFENINSALTSIQQDNKTNAKNYFEEINRINDISLVYIKNGIDEIKKSYDDISEVVNILNKKIEDCCVNSTLETKFESIDNKLNILVDDIIYMKNKYKLQTNTTETKSNNVVYFVAIMQFLCLFGLSCVLLKMFGFAF